MRREYLVIESSMKNAVFIDEAERNRVGYIPRDIAEELLGRDLSGQQWFTREDSAKMHAHPEYREKLP